MELQRIVMFEVGDTVEYTGGLYWPYKIGTRFVVTCSINSNQQWLGMVCPEYKGSNPLIISGQKAAFYSTCFKLASKKRPWNVRM